jgi:transcriptional regulator with XRE-family HTH domain
MSTSIKTPAELQKELGDGIRQLRINRRLTQQQLAAKAGISPLAVAKLERAEGSNVSTLIRVLHALGATDFIASLAPAPQVSPLALLRTSSPPQRVRHRRAA